MRSRLLIPLLGSLLAPAAVRGDDFFETRVRPVLAEHCFKCHGEKQQKGGIRLDGPTHLKAPADGSGPLVVPGKPDESRLIQAVRRTGEFPMPPNSKLPEPAVRALTEWVKNGAEWPRVAPRRGADHWAFQPVKLPAIPSVKAAGWPNSDIDRFVLARLEAKGLAPSFAADRRTLLRRVTFDLTGLPPTPEEIAVFLADESPDAYAKAVDRLLASPAFGERWARHWLDVARYSDTRGVNGGDYQFAYTYRDWVVKAFNDDLAYDQFLLKQIAADHLTRSESHPDLAALGLLTLGRRFDENEPDIIDDRIDTIFRGTQALTVSCARCHDHKYDPIPIADYYSLYGVFANFREKDAPLIAGAADRTRYLAYAAELRSRTRSLARFDTVERRRLFGFHQTQADRYLLAAAKPGGKAKEDAGAREDGLNQTIVDRYREFLEASRAEHHPVMAPWHAFARLKPAQFASTGKRLAKTFSTNDNEEKPINPLVARLFAGKSPTDLEDVARRYGRLFATVARKWQRVLDDADTRDLDRPTRLPDDDEEEIRALLFGAGGQAPLSDGMFDIGALLSEDKQQVLNQLRTAVDQWQNGPDTPPHAHVLEDPEELEPARVFIRGKADQLGDEVPRRFPAILTGPNRVPFSDGTGRLELARAIANKDNPLTARVWANRVWSHLIGRPLVDTPSDFGDRSSPPTHPELLDWLADSLVRDNWSTKQLIRKIVLTQTYRQSSMARVGYPARAGAVGPAVFAVSGSGDPGAVDPGNQLLWRMNRKRLELEPFRDALLAASGNLDRTVGGRPVEPLSGRRTLYLTVDRGNLAAEFRAFDFANPVLHSPGRHETIVPAQALFLMNSPFVVEQARGLARRVDSAEPDDDEAWTQAAYQVALGRDPSADELAASLKFLKAASAAKSTGPQSPPVHWKYGRGRWDADKKRLVSFVAFAQFQEDRWQAGAEYPDPKLGSAALTAEGGHPGQNRDQVVVRQWIAPGNGTVEIGGVLKHELPPGEKPERADGVRGYVVAGGKLLAEADVFNKEVETPVASLTVKAGDRIDFIVDPKANDTADTFTWKVGLTFHPAGKPTTEVGFDSAEEFRGPPAAATPLSPYEKLAQVLLMSNEFLYVD